MDRREQKQLAKSKKKTVKQEHKNRERRMLQGLRRGFNNTLAEEIRRGHR